MQILDGRKHFVQWDKDVKLTATDLKAGEEIHFDNGTTQNALVVLSEEYEDKIVANVPNILLTNPFQIKVYRYVETDDGSYTKKTILFDVEPRKKPDDYVYTPTEIWDYRKLEDRVAKLEQGGGGGGGGQAGFSPTVKITPIENGHRVTITDINGDHSYEVFNGEKGDDYVLTEADKNDIANLVLANFTNVSEVGR